MFCSHPTRQTSDTGNNTFARIFPEDAYGPVSSKFSETQDHHTTGKSGIVNDKDLMRQSGRTEKNQNGYPRLVKRRFLDISGNSKFWRYMNSRKYPDRPVDRVKPFDHYLKGMQSGVLLWYIEGSWSAREGSWDTYTNTVSKGTEWDDNDPFVNYVMHPYTGMIWHGHARESNWTPIESIAFCILATLFWEFAQEPWFGEVPSNQDLITNVAVGSLLAELGFVAKMYIDDHVQNKPLNWGLSVLVYPGGEISKTWDWLERMWQRTGM
jgi:hypothetical protein